ncbi:MAG: hypothetical protein L0Z07_07195 [Planctomycetes bacterium]|nr:hypothetical protein [Planctomycetota bacterium]
MKKRETILAGIVGALVLGFVVDRLVTSVLREPKNELQARIDSIQRKIEAHEKSIERGREAGAKLAEWRKRSLPSDLEKARSAYQAWLLEVVRQRGLEGGTVSFNEVTGKNGVYYRLPVMVRGRGTLEQVTTVLHDFYRAIHLHQIQRLNITPVPNSRQLDVTLGIEALILPDAEQTDKLAEGRSTRLSSDRLADYHVIAQRDLFGDGGIGFDPADFTYLTGINGVNDVQEAWFTVRTTGETLKLKVGQRFEVGDFQGTVADIDERDVVIDSDGERWLLTLGEQLSQATALPPEY